MESPWYALMTNVAVVAFFVSVWTQLRDVFERFGPRAVEVAFGLAMGLGAITAMLFPVQLSPGVFFDLRTCLLALAAFFGGPFAAAVAVVLTASYRLWIGGAGVPVGLAAISLVTAAALIGHLLRRRRGRPLARWHSLALAVATGAIGVAVVLLAPASIRVANWPLIVSAQTLLLFLAVLFSGLALTRDEELRTARRDNLSFRQAIDERQRVLGFAMAQMSDGVAMFDRSGRLLFCNAQYQQLFPLTSDVRIPGAHIRDILATAVARREQQVGASPSHVAVWIDEIVASLERDSEEEVHLFDGSWLRVSTRPSPDGVSMVVVSDITRLKRTELELLDVTERLRQEATTDALTGLVNRRALDQRLEIEIARSLRSDGAISVILLDIDLFKAYNDTYGHLAGDACLQAVSQCLGQVFRRPADLVARYGGEEFLVVLPDVGADAAYVLANQYREVLATLALPHKASTFGQVTVSLGVASYAPGETDRTAADLVGHADEALYAAKTAGRDQVSGWRRRFSVVPRSLRVVR
jgi:diguanylate cyclase (GGDEF)-like protein